MTVTYDEDQLVPSLNALGTGTVMGAAYSIPVMLDSDSDSISSLISSDSVDSHSVVASPTWQLRSGAEGRRRHRVSHTTEQPMMTLTGSGAFTVRDTRATISAMQRLAGRIVRKAARGGRKRLNKGAVSRWLMKRDIERRDRYINELREANRLLELQMREAEIEVERLFERFVRRFVDPYAYNDSEFE
uniref:BZIP domain-containing protein n=1 Tax=Parascaris univalens TaxID=6257 RepID=A0A915ABK5_PARUN